jgi:hypothetical protein
MYAAQTFDAQIADDFAGLAIENGLTPMAKDMASRLEEQKLQSELAATAACNNELKDKVKSLEEKSAALEENLMEIQATSSKGPSTYITAKSCDRPEAQPEEVAQLKELVDLLDIQNASFKEELEDYKNDPLDGRVTRLQNQLEIYKKLLTSDRFAPGDSLRLLAGTQMQKLVKSGLHRHNPARSYVSETYYRYSEVVKDRMEQKVRQDAVKPASAFAFDTGIEKVGQPYVPLPGELEISWEEE